VIADDDGQFALERVAPGTTQLTFTDRLGHELRTEDNSSIAAPPAVAARSVRSMRLDLTPGQDRRLGPIQVVER
jgi:hypothetical protein